MASVNNNWYFNSLILKFLTTPFRIAWIFLVILVIVFGVSTVTQTYYHQPNLLQQEIEQLKQVGTKPILRRNNEAGSASINIWVSEQSYRALYALFFQLTQIEDAFYAQNESDKGYRLKQYLIKHQEAVKRFDETLKSCLYA